MTFPGPEPAEPPPTTLRASIKINPDDPEEGAGFKPATVDSIPGGGRFSAISLQLKLIRVIIRLAAKKDKPDDLAQQCRSQNNRHDHPNNYRQVNTHLKHQYQEGNHNYGHNYYQASGNKVFWP
jgi:hypothetical protein